MAINVDEFIKQKIKENKERRNIVHNVTVQEKVFANNSTVRDTEKAYKPIKRSK